VSCRRKAVLARDGLVVLCNLLEESQSALECLPEALLLGGQDPVNLFAVLLELRISGLHPLDHHIREGREVGRFEPDPSSLLHGATDDPPHHVAPALVRGRNAVGGEEGHAATMIGEHSVRLGCLGESPYATPLCSAIQPMIAW